MFPRACRSLSNSGSNFRSISLVSRYSTRVPCVPITHHTINHSNHTQLWTNQRVECMSTSSSSPGNPKDSARPVGRHDLQLYSLGTPNGMKVAIMLEELGIPYDAHTIPIGGPNAKQFTPWFIELNPNSKIPVIVDQKGPDGKPFTVFESGAILIYLAEKYGKFLPQDVAGRTTTIQWVMFQMGGIGPMMGQMNHFHSFAPEQIPYAKQRYTNEVQRLLRVLEGRLAVSSYIAGSDYSIADIAIYPWIRNMKRWSQQGIDFKSLPHVSKYIETIRERPAVQRALNVTPM